MSNLQRLTNASYGIECWLKKQGLKSNTAFVSKLTAEFLKFKKLPYSNYNPKYKGLFTANIANAELVQEHFKEFQVFVIEKYKNTSTCDSQV